MKTVTHPRLIGLFVLLGLALWTGIIIMWGSGGYFSTLPRYVIYFEGSVNGLAAGSVVRLKGVTIGKVIQVKVRYNVDDAKIMTPVIAEMDLGKIIETNTQGSPAPELDTLVEQGLRARLGVQSLVSNQLYVDLEFLPKTTPHLAGIAEQTLPEIPTVSSSKEELERTLEFMAREVRELPLKDTVDATLQVLRHTDQLLSKPETSASIDRLNDNLVELKGLIRQLHGELPPLLSSATETMKQAKASLTSVSDFVQTDSELSIALKDVSEAARSIRRLADTLERHPDAVLYGRKPTENK
jgi:paraquat-inducible protein B